MTKKQNLRRQSQLQVYFVLVLIALIAIAGAVFYFIERGRPSKEHMDAADYFGNPQEGEAAVVTSEGLCEQIAVVRDGVTYIHYDDVRTKISNKVYFDADDEILTITTPDTIKNFTEGDGEAAFIMRDGLPMISSEILSQWTDIACTSISEPDRLVIRTDFTLPKASFLADTAIRREPSIKSPIIKDGLSGEEVTILSSSEEFLEIFTEDGFIGYVESSELGEEHAADAHESTLSEYTSLSMNEKINMVFHQTDRAAANAYLDDMLVGTSGINVIAPTWFFLDDTSGSFIDLADEDYVKNAHERGLKVFAVANDFDGGIASGAETTQVLMDTTQRQALAKKLVDAVLRVGADGINLDFENVNTEGADAYLAFVREMSVLCRNNGLFLSVDTYVPESYNHHLDVGAYAEVIDFVLIMAYDEHHKGSEKAGSVSSISWVRSAITEAVDGGVPLDKLVIGIPFYTRLWETTGGNQVTSTAMTMREALEYVDTHSMKVTWDEETQQNKAVLEGATVYEIWLEDTQSVTAKMRVISSYDLAGVAEWKLGQEDTDVWRIIESFLS